MDPTSGAIVAQTATGASVVLGLMQCARIWLCPVCSATIRHRRSEEIGRGVVEWLQRGGKAYLVTFTARHAAAHRLADLMDAIQGTRKTPTTPRRPGAYQRLITGGTWAGRPDRGKDGIRDRVGYVGMIRATEVTLGQANGWHPHIHAIVLVGGRTEGTGADRRLVETFDPGTAALEEWQGQWRSVWTAHLRQVDREFTPSDEHGVDFKPLETAQDAEDLSKYIAKLQDGKDPALELARADLKRGRGTMAPFELLARIGDLLGGVDPDDAPGHGEFDWCLTRWHEYERATSGRRAIEWTRHLRALLGLDGGDSSEDDQDLLAESAAAGGEFRGGVRVTETGWNAVTRRALDLAAVQAGEGTDANTNPDAMATRVTEVVVLAGGSAADAQQLSSADITQAYADLLAALAQRREAAAARRKAEKQDQDDESDRDATVDRARRAIQRRAGDQVP